MLASSFNAQVFFSQALRNYELSQYQLFRFLNLHFQIDACWKSGTKLSHNRTSLF